MKERDCTNFKHHTSDGCSSWDCEFEAKDLISRADAIKAVASITMSIHLSEVICDKLLALPSADAVSREFYVDAVKANIGLVIENSKLKEQIESADAVQGEWIYDHHNDEHTCSVCGKKALCDDYVGIDWQMEVLSDYCPNCGAIMKGGAK